MAQAIALVTAEQFERFPTDHYCELIDGVVIDLMPPGEEHGHIAAKIAAILFQAEAAGLGMVLVESGYVLRRNPDTVRGPDVAFRLKAQLSAGLSRGFGQGAPDIVVEIVSPSNTAAEIQGKIRDFIEAGAGLMLVVYPASRTVTAIRSLQERESLTEEDILDFAPVLSGFTCRVADFF